VTEPDSPSPSTIAAGSPHPFERFARRASETFASLVVLTLVSAAFAVLTARVLGPSAKGVVTVLLLIPGIGALVIGGALELANTYFGASRPSVRGELLANSIVVSAAGGAAVALALAGLGVSGHRFGGSWLELVLVAASVPLVAASRLASLLILASGRTRAFNVLGPLGQTLLLVLTAVGFAVFGAHGLAVVAAYAVAQPVVLAAVLAVAQIRPARPSWPLFVEGFRYGVYGFSANLVQVLNLRLDFFLLSALRSSSAVGIYSVATTMAELLGKVPAAASTILLPRIASGAPGGHAFTARVARVVLALTLVGGVALAAFSGFAIRLLFGDAFSGAFTPLLLLLPGTALLAVASVLTSDLAGRGAPRVLLYGALIGLVVTVGGNAALIPAYGASGAALASTIAYAAGTAFVVALFARRFGTRLADLFVPRRADFRASVAPPPGS
jgi:stage V sporulation protein B